MSMSAGGDSRWAVPRRWPRGSLVSLPHSARPDYPLMRETKLTWCLFESGGMLINNYRHMHTYNIHLSAHSNCIISKYINRKKLKRQGK